MSNKTKHGVPTIGGPAKIIEIGKFNYNLIVVLSDHPNPKDQEMVFFRYAEHHKAIERRAKILKEGISLTQTEGVVEVELFYPANQIRKIIIRKEPLKMGDGSKLQH